MRKMRKEILAMRRLRRMNLLFKALNRKIVEKRLYAFSVASCFIIGRNNTNIIPQGKMT
jgi:hypothetical protein